MKIQLYLLRNRVFEEQRWLDILITANMKIEDIPCSMSIVVSIEMCDILALRALSMYERMSGAIMQLVYLQFMT